MGKGLIPIPRVKAFRTLGSEGFRAGFESAAETGLGFETRIWDF